MTRRLLTLAVLAALSLSAPWAVAGDGFLKYDARAGSAVFASDQKHHSRAENEAVDFRVTGQVAQGQTFEQDIGRGLLFRLVPPANAPDAGWVIQVIPKTEPADGPIEFSSIATPPYHVYNDRILATAFGRSASDVVQLKDRTFFFVQSAMDEHRAEEVVNAAFYPTNLSDQERVRAAAEAHEVHVSKGELRILKSHTGHGKMMSDVGSIEWIRFELDIEFSPGLTMADIIARVARPQ